MWKSLLWFSLGYLTARYLILKNGVDGYVAKENQLINKGTEFKEDIQEEYFPQ
jgi:hypothetical protein